MTPLQQAYKKEINRIKRTITRAKKQGIFFPDSVIPQMPNRVTQKRLKDIQELRGDVLYSKSVILIEPETGVTAPTLEIKKYRRKTAAKKAVETRKKNKLPSPSPVSIGSTIGGAINFSNVVISNWRKQVSHFPRLLEPILSNWMDRLLSTYDVDEVAGMIEEGVKNGFVLDYSMAYDYGLIMQYASGMMQFLPGFEGIKEDIIDAIEEEEGGYII